MSHAYHDFLPGFSRAQILHDQCTECEARAREHDHGISHLDAQNFVRAWIRAAAWNTTGVQGVAAAEVPLLSTLWSLQLRFERRGIPIGEVPSGF